MIIFMLYERSLNELKFNYYSIFNQFFILIKVHVTGIGMGIWVPTERGTHIKFTIQWE